jgi:hypothetical protein
MVKNQIMSPQLLEVVYKLDSSESPTRLIIHAQLVKGMYFVTVEYSTFSETLKMYVK